MLSKLNGALPNSISTKELDISDYPLKKLRKLYWITAIGVFKNWISKFSKYDGTRWWIRKDWSIIWEWYEQIWDFLNWFAIFHRKDKSQWWISEDWKILMEWCQYCGKFLNWIATFKDINWAWWIDNTWKIIAQWKYINVMDYEREWFARFTYGLNILGKLDLKFKNWFCPFYMPSLHKFWWLSDTWVILADYLDKTYRFDEDIEWYARFSKDWIEWYMNSQWNILNYKGLFKLDWKFEWFSKFEKNDWSIWFLDSKLREWDWIDNKNWILYLKKWGKLFKRSMIK